MSRSADSYCSPEREKETQEDRDGAGGGMSIRNETRPDRQTGTSKLVKNRRGISFDGVGIIAESIRERNLSFG